MIAVSLVLVMALVSSTVVAQPGIKGLTGPLDYSKQKTILVPSETSTKLVYEWIPPRKWALKSTSNINSVKIGLKYILKKLKLQPDEFKVMTSFTDHLKITHVYGVPLHKGLKIGNLHGAAHVKNGRAFFYSATIMDNPRLTKRSPITPDSIVKKSSEEAVKTAVDYFKIPFHHDIAPVMEYCETSDEHIPVWKFQLRDNSITQWIEIKVNANTGGIVSSQDFKRGFTYTAIELPNKSPKDGFSTIVHPENTQSSPNGWTEGYKLTGNNVLTILEGGKTFEMATKGVFGGIFDPLLPPQTPKNIMAGAVNAFYVANMVHDVFYAYGFTELAGNFQEDNFKRGGIEEDPIIINIQKSDKQNGAYFNTPPDGQSGVLNLHIFTATNPNRDPALDNTLTIHELAHGLSSRLTGGARTKLCMAETESRGLSEGYSDMVALILTAKPEDTRNTNKVMGEYVKGNPGGVRRYPYTTDMRVNPLKYQNAVGETNHYNLGEIWATMLLEVYWNFVEKYGFSANLHDATQKRGNIMFLQILVGTLMIQPCKLTFDSARDAMLAADYAYYGGINKRLIRQGFAKRGLGSIS
ncbi:hypothetical protein BASA50_007160 [Batrachochytrium salamandrivorans]|uniref:Extracellular metalloproteinase n=1 Tax=Batrachochytrium salamandrivorans TaxID=1357716 RepID=A0ABQ8F7T4_9FUNG|nr:hypothetical protein BASA61_005599 [Batrachochytrium salamandrivorans]KAH6593724.1 hypothetical protein BASA50_007160 [Batrachochytrium salamandrivorans]KAH9265191.1 hypothetical protein BASA83_011274 [Batrachochytrium salamandrivorans]